MLVTSIDNINSMSYNGSLLNITIGKRYKVIEYDNIGYKIMNDQGMCLYYIKGKFEPLETSRNKILEELGI
jgi:hypothetical protein